MPALPLDEAGKYVAGAYVVFLALILIYVAIMAAKLGRVERELTELNRELDVREGGDGDPVVDQPGEQPAEPRPEREVV